MIRIAVANMQFGVGTTNGYWQFLSSAWKYLLPHSGKFLARGLAAFTSNQIDLALCVETRGDAFVGRYPILEQRVYPLISGPVSRFLKEALMEIEGKKVTVGIAHLSLGTVTRQKQLEEIARIVRETKGPLILGGDFNARADAEFETLTSAGLTEVPPVPTFPSWGPRYALLRLFVSEDFRIIGRHALTLPRFSDHLPLIAEIELRQ